MVEPFRIVSICTGNSCRSPAAEALIKHQISQKGIKDEVEISSAGISARDGASASPEAVASIEKKGASLQGFSSRTLTEEISQKAHLLLAKEHFHKEFVEEFFPKYADKVRMMGDFLLPNGPREIPDPIGADQNYFDQVIDAIDLAAQNLVEHWEEIKNRYYPIQKHVIAIGADHRGFQGKEKVKTLLEQQNYIVMDCGTTSEIRCDHPDFAFMVSERVTFGMADRGVLVCSSGHGMIISSNKVPGIRAIMPLNVEHAKIARSHNNSNVITFGADYMEMGEIEEILQAWLDTAYLGGRYQSRINKISQYERMIHA